ncbi:MAG: hypothetical protein R8K20_07620 [Gallionellaceae bacterium]
MANNLIVRSKAAAYLTLVLLLLCGFSLLTSAEVLIDPTKPPAEIGIQPEALPAEVATLQSIIISPLRRAAILNGQTVELGGKIGGVTLIEVSESGVVLQGKGGRQVLTLFPNVRIDKKIILPPTKHSVRHTAKSKALASKPKHSSGKKEMK